MMHCFTVLFDKFTICWLLIRISEYRVVKLNFTLEIEVFYILFEISLSIFISGALALPLINE